MNVIKKELQKELVNKGKKVEIISIRCSTKDKADIRRAAKSLQRSVSSYFMRLHHLATETENTGDVIQ